MLLSNLEIIRDQLNTCIHVHGDKISALDNDAYKRKTDIEIHFDNAIAFPGLINSHDHLDFNLFPQLGNRIYNNYVEWGEDIHLRDKKIINKVLQIPEHLRTKWGIYKNLANGITTVVNHGNYLQVNNDLISVFQNYHFLHSVKLEKKWKYKLNNPLKTDLPFVIHVGEGSDDSCYEEIDELIKWNILKRPMVGVHGIAMSKQQATHFKGLVWCPASNYFLIGKTADIETLKQVTHILFGTDSTLSAGWNIWDHIRLARSHGVVSDTALFDMVSLSPAKVWDLKKVGKIEAEYDADIVVAKRKNQLQGIDAYCALNPEDILMVMHKGNVVLFDSELLKQMNNTIIALENFSKVIINGVVKYIYGNLPALMGEIRSFYKEVTFPFESYSQI